MSLLLPFWIDFLEASLVSQISNEAHFVFPKARQGLYIS